MDVGLLKRLFGSGQDWIGPCTVVLNAEAAVQTAGSDSIAGGGAKVYAPRTVSGRVNADSACLLRDGSAIFMIQQIRLRQPTGEETVKQTLTIADPRNVVAVEFAETVPLVLSALGLTAPAIRGSGSHSGIVPKPRAS
jgi:hypothetical protein